MGIFVGSLDFRGLGPVALGTVEVGKGSVKSKTAKPNRRIPLKYPRLAHLRGHVPIGPEWNPPADMCAVFQISAANSGWEFGYRMDRVHTHDSPSEGHLQKGKCTFQFATLHTQ